MKRKALILLLIGFLFCQSGSAQNEYLMVIDVQKKFYENTKLEQRANEMVQNINSLIERFDPEKVIYVKATAKTLIVSLNGIKSEAVFPAPELDTELQVVNDQIFTKIEGSAFSVVELNNLLQKRGIKKVTLVGLLAEKCVYKTAIDGIEKGYDIFIAKDAVLSKSASKKAKIFRKMTKKGVKIVPLEDLLKYD